MGSGAGRAAVGEDSAAGRVLAGRVIKPHGTRGEVVVVVFSDRPERFEPGAVLYADNHTFVVASARSHQGRLLVHFEEVGDRTTAERLCGARLEADPLPCDEERDTYLVSELIGMPVVSEDGCDLGVVEAVVELPAVATYDLLEVAPAEGPTWLLPAAEEYVEVQEDETGLERLVVVSPPEGLVPDEITQPRAERAPGRSGSEAVATRSGRSGSEAVATRHDRPDPPAPEAPGR